MQTVPNWYLQCYTYNWHPSGQCLDRTWHWIASASQCLTLGWHWRAQCLPVSHSWLALQWPVSARLPALCAPVPASAGPISHNAPTTVQLKFHKSLIQHTVRVCPYSLLSIDIVGFVVCLAIGLAVRRVLFERRLMSLWTLMLMMYSLTISAMLGRRNSNCQL